MDSQMSEAEDRVAVVTGGSRGIGREPGGALVNYSSSVTRFARPGNIAYTVTKDGVEAISLVLSRELQGRDVTVNAVAPGPVEAEMFASHLGGDDGLRAEVAARSPFGRVGTAAEIAEVV
jgi:3-oxoacyl-[acyl-carrier protein] reductase